MYTYEVTFISNKTGKTIVRKVDARNEFEATQVAGAFNCVIVSVINLDL